MYVCGPSLESMLCCPCLAFEEFVSRWTSLDGFKSPAVWFHSSAQPISACQHSSTTAERGALPKFSLPSLISWMPSVKVNILIHDLKNIYQRNIYLMFNGLILIVRLKPLPNRRPDIGKCFTCVTKTIANLTTYSRKPGDYNGTIIFEIDIMKNSSPLNLIFTFFAMSKPK